MTRSYLLISLLFIAILFASCSGSKEGGESSTADPVQVENDLSSTTEEKYDYVISNIPIPFEILDRLFKSGVSFKKELTNPVENASKYLQNNSKALNLGIYGADLTYTICFEKFNELNPYLKNSKKLADDLGIPLAFNNETLEKYESYRTNKDSLRNAVYESYNEVDRTLKSNERISLAALVVTGGWVEGLYIASSTATDTTLAPEAQNELYAIVRRQSFHLDNIINLLNEFKSDAYFQQLITELQEIQGLYTSMKKSDIRKEDIVLLQARVAMLRAKIIEG